MKIGEEENSLETWENETNEKTKRSKKLIRNITHVRRHGSVQLDNEDYTGTL